MPTNRSPIRRFSESLPILLLRAREVTVARFRPILYEFGLTEQQWRTLRALDEVGEMTGAAVAREAAVLAPSMTRILRRLADDGLVRVDRSKRDQRELKVRVSPRGRRLVRRIGPRMEHEYAQICEQLGKEQLDALHLGLRELIALGKR
jgi:homoprotocatechuate degradation regulator HpaR